MRRQVRGLQGAWGSAGARHWLLQEDRLQERPRGAADHAVGRADPELPSGAPTSKVRLELSSSIASPLFAQEFSVHSSCVIPFLYLLHRRTNSLRILIARTLPTLFSTSLPRGLMLISLRLCLPLLLRRRHQGARECTQLTSVNWWCQLGLESSGGRFLSELRTSPLFLWNFPPLE